MKFPSFACLVVTACALVSCLGVLLSCAPSETVDSGSLGPSESYKAARVREALAGLDFATGRVVVDRPTPGGRVGAEERVAEGLSKLAQNRTLEALVDLAAAVRSSPEWPGALEPLARALRLLGEKDRAEAVYRKALDVAPNDLATQTGLAGLLDSMGRRLEGADEWRRVLALDGDSADAHVALAISSYYLDDLDAAREHADRATELHAVMPAAFEGLLAAARSGFADAVPRARQNPPAAGDPIIGPQVRVDVGGGVEASNETSIAAAQVGDEVELVATWNDWRRSGGFELINMGVGVSLDSGASWVDGLVRPPPANQSDVEGDPMTAYDPRTGTLWVGAISFTGGGGLYVARKEPGDPFFQPSVAVQAEAFADKCWMAAGPLPQNPDSTALYIGYNNGVQRSFDMGDSWERRDLLATGLGFLPRVADDGSLYVSYWDAGFATSSHKVVLSEDAATTVEPVDHIVTRMDNWGTQDGSRFPGDFRVPPLGSLAVDPIDETLFFVYPDTTNVVGGNSNVDLYFMTSTDSGETWSPPVVVNGDSTPPGDQFFPWIEKDEAGRLHMVFFDSRHVAQDDNSGGNRSGFFDAYYSYSDDDGASWTESRLTPESFDSFDDGLDRFNQFIGDYNGLAIAGGNAYPHYLSTQNGDADVFVHSITRGAQPALVLSNPDPGQAGVTNQFTVTGATAGATVRLIAGTTDGSLPVPGCAGVSIDMVGPTPLGSAVADISGVAVIDAGIPNGAGGRTALFQAVEQTACRVSNRVTFAFP